MTERLARQVQFLVEIDKLKHIFRRTRLFNRSRHENDAEHAWHLGMMALVLSEYAAEPRLDVTRVVKMVLIHDLVEIDAGDTFLYAEALRREKQVEERAAAERIFGLLPDDQRAECLALWQEFERRETPEARFAAAIDRLQPILQNCLDEGYAWQKHGVTAEQVERVNRHIADGSPALWEYARELIHRAVAAGHLAAGPE